MKYEIELHSEEIKNIKRIRNYFGEHDKTMLEHMAYNLLDKLVKNLTIPVVTHRTFTKGQKVKVLVGCIWQKAEVEDYHPDPKYYLCGTNNWSTHFHENSIKEY